MSAIDALFAKVPAAETTSVDAARTDIEGVAERAVASGGEIADAVEQEVRRTFPLATQPERNAVVQTTMARLVGLGQLDDAQRDPTVDEILVNGDTIWVERRGQLECVGQLGAPPIEQIVERILAPLGRRLDRTSPIVDARLPNGSRLCAVVDPVAVGGSVLSIRKFPASTRPLPAFTDQAGVDLCRHVLDAGANVLVSGATSSGKTSLLAALIDELPTYERLVIVEDTAELPIVDRHSVRLEARQPSPDGPPEIDVADLVRSALRLRPDRLVVGEVRGREVIGLIQALNTGHDGSLSTCHANGPLDALNRLATLTLLAAPHWTLAAVERELHRTIDVVVHVARVDTAKDQPSRATRRIVSIHEVGEIPGTVRPLAELDRTGQLRVSSALQRGRR